MGTVVDTALGRLQGTLEGGIHAFLGIPFAKPPVGPLRFRPPEKPEPWPGTREATSFGGSAPQNPMLLAMLPGMEVGRQDDDCLYLNVYTPGTDDRKRPVLVWIHGGAFILGSGSQALYDGRPLASRGDAVVVTINYRLGILGFLDLRGVGGDDFGASPNAGLLDQVAALEWVRDNVAAFGGDPENVTIFGESAGGMSVGTLLGTPSARGLFQRAIAQSGAGHSAHDREGARLVAERTLEKIGLGPGQSSQLQDLPVEKLLAAQGALALEPSPTGALLTYQPVVDGEIVPQLPVRSVAAGSASGVSVLIGTMKEEWKLFGFADPEIRKLDLAGLEKRLSARLDGSGAAERLVGAYREADPEADPAELFFAIETDRVFRIPAVRLAEAQLEHGSVHAYRMDWKSPSMGGLFGACHAVDIPFVFGTHAAEGVENFIGSGSDVEVLAGHTMDAWIGFARNGTPGHAGIGEWPEYDDRTRATMLFDAECKLVEDPAGATRAAWDGWLE